MVDTTSCDLQPKHPHLSPPTQVYAGRKCLVAWHLQGRQHATREATSCMQMGATESRVSPVPHHGRCWQTLTPALAIHAVTTLLLGSSRLPINRRRLSTAVPPRRPPKWSHDVPCRIRPFSNHRLASNHSPLTVTCPSSTPTRQHGRVSDSRHPRASPAPGPQPP